jgi:response regulator RpfG family c-di-GMP phosphodiesterase
MTAVKAKILLVDDEPQILEGLTRGLRGAYDVRTATSGVRGLEVLASESDIAIVVSDMRMPLMNGTSSLTKARETAPDAVRLLLTGQADMEDAVAAINEGHVFRFLKKPCSPDVMRTTLADAAEQHRLVIAERTLLEQTLRGAVQALCDTLALANPGVFGMAMRVKRVASTIASRLGGVESWQIEVAAMVCQLGAMTVPPAVYERRARGEALLDSEREMLARVPAITDQLLAPIPRLEPVREMILRSRSSSPHAPGDVASLGACILAIALDFEELESAGVAPPQAVARMRSRGARYDARAFEALESLYRDTTPTTIDVPIGMLLEGMIIASDIVMKNGALLVSRGHEVTPGLVARLRNFADSLGCETVRIVGDGEQQPVRRH